MITPGTFVFVSGRNVTFVRKNSPGDTTTFVCEHYVRYDCVLSGVVVATFTTTALCKLLHLDWAFFVSPLIERVDNVISVVVRAADVCINKKQFSSVLMTQAAAENIQITMERIAWGSGFFVVSYELSDIRALNQYETSLSYAEPREIICV